MSFLLRSSKNTLFYSGQQVIKRQAHKKANIAVRLNQFVENIGRQDEVVSVRPGLMRNVLYPAGKATYIDKSQEVLKDAVKVEEKQQNEIQQERLKMFTEEAALKKDQLLDNLEQIRELEFNRAVVPNSDHTFGSVTAEDLINKIKEKFGLNVDKSTIEFKSEGGRIKSLGKHQVLVQLNNRTTEITVIVKPAN
ncbi:MAG: hypothetical protein EXX96DRAFT_615227 [Benjaminiella poitrasii]|nr:MAG: hypothetical protein EXX96DRAFT_615227 [Benjaminiella poitrasii]